MATQYVVEKAVSVEKTKVLFELRGFPFHSDLVNLAKRMGFQENDVTKNGEHSMVARDVLTLKFNPQNRMVFLERKLPSGRISQEIVVDGLKTPFKEIVKKLSFSVFMYGDEQVQKTIDTDKDAWNRAYADTHGTWS